MENVLIRILLLLRPLFRIKGGYRIARKLYNINSHRWNGIWIEKPYLDDKFHLKIRLWSKDLIDHKILFTGYYEKATNDIITKHVKPGDVVLEAGANSGTETLFLSRIVGDEGHVMAFEPVPHIVQKLIANIELNELKNVTVETFALGQENKEIAFFIAAPPSFINQGMGSIKKVHQMHNTEISAQQIMVDKYCKDRGIVRLDFIKMDIQGAEEAVLIGAKETISKFQPIIFLEAGESRSSIDNLFNILSDYGYTVYHISKNSQLQLMTTSQVLMDGNWLCFPDQNKNSS